MGVQWSVGVSLINFQTDLNHKGVKTSFWSVDMFRSFEFFFFKSV